MSTTLAPSDRHRNLLFLAQPRHWPAWPFLPLIRRIEGECECGLLCDLMATHDLAGYSATVFLSNLFLLPSRLDEFLALSRETFDTPEEVFDAGWRID